MSGENKGNKRILIATVALGVLLVFVVAFSIILFYSRLSVTQSLLADSEYKTYDKYYVMITENRDTDFWKTAYQGALAEGERSGAYVELMGDNLDKSLSKEDLLRIAINSNVDGIIVEGDDTNATLKQLLKAEEAGIPVVTVGDDNVESRRISYIGVSGYNLGKDYGMQLTNYVREEGIKDCHALVLLDDAMTSNSQSIIISAIKEVISSEGLSNVISLDNLIVSTRRDYAAEEKIRDIFVGDSTLDYIPDVIICLSEKNTTCVYQTVVDVNMVGEVEIFGYYMSPIISAAIDKNIIRSSIVIDTQQLGIRSVKALNEYKESGYVSEMYLIDTLIVTKDNISDFSASGSSDSSGKNGGDD